eukprot:10886321-Ditylum_brightwellii.AAC.1
MLCGLNSELIGSPYSSWRFFRYIEVATWQKETPFILVRLFSIQGTTAYSLAAVLLRHFPP